MRSVGCRKINQLIAHSGANPPNRTCGSRDLEGSELHTGALPERRSKSIKLGISALINLLRLDAHMQADSAIWQYFRVGFQLGYQSIRRRNFTTSIAP